MRNELRDYRLIGIAGAYYKERRDVRTMAIVKGSNELKQDWFAILDDDELEPCDLEHIQSSQ